MSRATIHLLVGLPGSGKTTLARHLHKLTGAIRLSSDDFRVIMFPSPTFSQAEHDQLYGILDHNVEHLLGSGVNLIYDANLNRREHRDEKYKLARDQNARAILWWLKTPDDVSKQRRLDDQDHALIPAGETPERMFDRIAEVFEPPDSDESYIEVDGSKLTEEIVKNLLNNATE